MQLAREERIIRFWDQLPSQLEMVLEQLAGTFVRRDESGALMYVSPLPLPFAYGACPTRIAEDGSGLDVILLGGASYALGDRIGVRILAVADFQDGSDWDPKLIARAVSDTRPLRRRDRTLVRLTLQGLARLKSSALFAGSKARPTQLWGIYPPWP